MVDWTKEEGIADEEVRERILKAVEARAAARTAEYGPEIMRYVEKAILLQTLDHNWREHIVNLDHLRQYVGLRGYGQRDPLNEYKSEAFELFEGLLAKLRSEVIAAGDACADPDRRAAADAGTAAPARDAGLAYRSAHRRGRIRPCPGGGGRSGAGRSQQSGDLGARSSATRSAPAAPGGNTSTATARYA